MIFMDVFYTLFFGILTLTMASCLFFLIKVIRAYSLCVKGLSKNYTEIVLKFLKTLELIEKNKGKIDKKDLELLISDVAKDL
jgi:hypothetical protein